MANMSEPEQSIAYYSIASNARGVCCLFGWAPHMHVADGIITRFQDNRVYTQQLIVAKFQQGRVGDAQFQRFAPFFVLCGEAAGNSVAGLIIGDHEPTQVDVITKFLRATSLATPAVQAGRVKLSKAVGMLRDKRTVDAALRLGADREWDAPSAAATIGIAYAVEHGLLREPSKGDPRGIGGPDDWTYGRGGMVNC